jgi:hypothetical protein
MIITPRLAQAFFIVNLQYLFKEHPDYPWKSDMSKTSIFIQGEYSEDARHQNILPGIIVETSGAVIATNGVGASMDGVSIHKLYLTKTTHQFAVQSTMTIHILAESKIEVEELGFEVLLFVASLKTECGKMGIGFIGEPTQTVARPLERQGQNNVYQSSVVFPFQFAVRREHTPIDPGLLLAEINTYLNLTNDQANDVVDDGKNYIKLRVTQEDVTAEQG